MTTLDTSTEMSSDLSYGLSRRPQPSQPFPFMAAFHFIAITAVALVCYVFTH